MRAMPTHPHKALAKPRSMGRRHQQTTSSLFKRNVSPEDDADALAAEGEEIHWPDSTIRLIQLQPALLGMVHGPVLHFAAGA
ncbi:MAG: hypothetical protein RLZZ117_1634 [Cyanobacteriota bacterium]|jgi:hypothetical protein